MQSLTEGYNCIAFIMRDRPDIAVDPEQLKYIGDIKTSTFLAFESSSSCGWASSSEDLDIDDIDFKPASDVIIQDQQTLYSFWCTM